MKTQAINTTEDLSQRASDNQPSPRRRVIDTHMLSPFDIGDTIEQRNITIIKLFMANTTQRSQLSPLYWYEIANSYWNLLCQLVIKL